jgi:hypothetical protein
MSEFTVNQAATQQALPGAFAPAAAAAHEWVLRGLFNAFLAVAAGTALTVVLWRAGYLASITSFLMAAGAVHLYAAAAGGRPRKGLVPLVLLIVAGVVGSFFAIVASDAWDVYSRFHTTIFESRSQFVLDTMFRPDVLGHYGSDLAMFALFGVLGVSGTMIRLLRSAR